VVLLFLNVPTWGSTDALGSFPF